MQMVPEVPPWVPPCFTPWSWLAHDTFSTNSLGQSKFSRFGLMKFEENLPDIQPLEVTSWWHVDVLTHMWSSGNCLRSQRDPKLRASAGGSVDFGDWLWPSGQRIALWMFFDRRIWFGNQIHIPNFARNSWYIMYIKPSPPWSLSLGLLLPHWLPSGNLT